MKMINMFSMKPGLLHCKASKKIKQLLYLLCVKLKSSYNRAYPASNIGLKPNFLKPG